MKKKIALLTSGGDAPGMNACSRAVVRYALSCGMTVFGVYGGYRGLVDGEVVRLDRRSVSDIIQRGGTFLKTARCPEFTEYEVRAKAAENLKEKGIDGLIVIGGDGSFRGARALSEDFGVKVIGIPGTIDNDLGYTDFTLGFDTAVNNVLWAINNLRDTMQSHEKVTFIEVMGRHCGDIALHAGVGGGAEYILVPEIPFDMGKIAEDILSESNQGKKSNMIVVAEGAGSVDDLARDFAERTGIEPRKTRLGHIQRGGSPSRFDRVFACRCAVRAVDLLREGSSGRVVGIRNGKIVDDGIAEALAKVRPFDEELYRIACRLS